MILNISFLLKDFAFLFDYATKKERTPVILTNSVLVLGLNLFVSILSHPTKTTVLASILIFGMVAKHCVRNVHVMTTGRI